MTRRQIRVARVALPDTLPDVGVPDAARIADYLAAGTAILFTTATAADRYDPAAGRPAGLSVRSDGEWVWSDVITYYTMRYGIPPEPGLLAHIRAADYVCPFLDRRQAAEALDAFAVARRHGQGKA